jgi:hypothetical protein
MYLQKLRSKQIRKNTFFVGILEVTDKKSRIRSQISIHNQVYDPKIQIQIRAKMSWFQNTAFVTQVSAGERGAMDLYVKIDAACHLGSEQ